MDPFSVPTGGKYWVLGTGMIEVRLQKTFVSHGHAHHIKRPHMAAFLLAFWWETPKNTQKLRIIRKNISLNKRPDD